MQNYQGISVSGKVVWEDGNNQAGLRPEKIIINLYRDGTLLKNKETTDVNIDSYSFTGLPKYTYDSNGNVNGTYKYTDFCYR